MVHLIQAATATCRDKIYKAYLLNQRLWQPCILFFLNCIIFWNVFPSFVYVDEFDLLYSQRFGSMQELFYRVFTSSCNYLLRPTYYFVFGIYYKLFNWNVAYCYILPFLAHFIAAMSVYYFLLRDENDSSFAAIGSILFLIYCGVWEPVGSIGGILYPMTAIFLLNAFICYFKRRYGCSFILFALALFTHQVSVLFVPLVLLYERVVNNKRFSMNSFNGLYASSFLTAAYLFLDLSRKLFFHAAPLAGQYVMGPHFIWNEMNYIATLFIPVITSYRMHAIFPGVMITAIDLVKLVVACLSPFGVLAVFFYGSNKAKYFMIWILLTLLPFTFFITPPVSRYLYIPSIGYAAGVALFIDHLLRKDRYKKIGAIIFILLFIVNLGGMFVYQKLFYNKKEIRREIYNDIRDLKSMFHPKERLCFVDLPIRDDEIKDMIYLVLKSEDFFILTVNADNVFCKQTFDPAIKKKYDRVFYYDCKGKKLKVL